MGESDRLCRAVSGACVVLGDFNAIVNIEERVGQAVREREMVDLRYCMENCQLRDIKATRSFYTWTNKQEGLSRVFCKLDRPLGNENWFEEWSEVEANFMPEGLKFFNMWSAFPRFEEVVGRVWNTQVHGTKMFQIVKKLKLLKPELTNLKKEEFGKVSVQDAITYQEMIQAQQKLQEDVCNIELAEKERICKLRYKEAHKHYVAFLSQKAKIKWIEGGDENTRILHQSIKMRRIHNRINMVQNGEGEWVSSANEVKDAFLNFYQDLLGSSENVTGMEQAIIEKGKVITMEQTLALSLEFTAEEIKQALFSIPDGKSLGLDGYTSHFFKKTWQVT
ncbi:uncharacterized protein LOC104897036 [Beta vulgaris subsp. vulgaris]|uniref:uncharacterized protein LOC104897036 n=1 Tax=Beta vulgaris subsp. vulgaris TaxID=3555 RepID=UPI002036F639|nr:uncharacterized protein LOC104897036 [Beta vulgaris subsp. vulgaris]